MLGAGLAIELLIAISFGPARSKSLSNGLAPR
jgi:hypothetical protein